MQRSRIQKKEKDELARWSVKDSLELYGIERWGAGVFTVNPQGHVVLNGNGETTEIDLKELVDEVRLRGLDLPVLIRFTDVLRRRLAAVVDAFASVMAEERYKGAFRGVYPIKVNQHRHVLEDIVELGRRHHWGFECGSKPELLLAIALHDDPEALIVCNGFKDRDYIETALFARRLGQSIFLVVEKLSELSLIMDAARETGVSPLIGLRIKLASRGKGLWEASGGDRSKFGLRANEVIEAVAMLKRRRLLNCLSLLHWHLGSQISDIQGIKDAVKEAASFYTELCRLGAPIRYLDAGGGMAVDYDGSHTNFASSANYTIAEYASSLVNTIAVACEEFGLPHPTIISEAGRALVAHHSVLVVEPIMTSHAGDPNTKLPELPRKSPEVLSRMGDVLTAFVGKNFQETFHDALETRRDALALFSLRHLSLADRALVEQYFWAICRRIRDYVSHLEYVPDDLADLEKLLSTTYFCNFSVFQSLPDHWAVKQLFPIVPLQRLNEKPLKRGVLADITCDSDGVINQFVDLRDVRDTLPLHPLNEGEPYYLGIFLVGAYQEILGDLHNLFGDTNAIHVSAGKNGYTIDRAVEGESMADVLDYVQFSRRDILALMRKRIECALRSGAMKLDDSAPFMRRIEEGLDEYTYYRVEAPKRPPASRRPPAKAPSE